MDPIEIEITGLDKKSRKLPIGIQSFEQIRNLSQV